MHLFYCANRILGLFFLFLLPLPYPVLAQQADPEPESPHRRPPIPGPETIAELPPDGGEHWNRLIFEKSPYLLQHAANPVDWYPWDEEAFARAKTEGKPIFLSIGYATCHWCHVMERECFEDEEVAALLNRHFIAVKVDREERPDIDEIYLTACRALTGGAGWPLTAILTHDKKPFFAGTYFPKHGKLGRPGLMELLPKIADFWKTRNDEILASAERITAALREMNELRPGAELDKAVLAEGFQSLSKSFDQEHGGFGSAPKFPVPHKLAFLLRYWQTTANPRALEMVEKSLAAMRQGGIFDQLGFGFHRYSVDAAWLTPHFEKMLYDQALLAMVYLEAFQATGKESYATTAREIFTYVSRDMTSPEGAFFSAEDADSGGEEGKFYLWTTEEVGRFLEEDSAKLLTTAFNLSDRGNFKDEATGKQSTANILHLTRGTEELAKEFKLSRENLEKRLDRARSQLLEARGKRVRPLRDDKVLTDWNGLMIAAFAKGAKALRDPELAKTAKRAADLVLKKLRTEDGRLLKRYRQGSAGLTAYLDDYAFLVWGLLELYEATFEIHYLRAAIALTDLSIRFFWDGEKGGFFLTPSDGEKLILRTKTFYDGALPAGNSVAALNLLRLGRITAYGEYERMAGEIFKASAERVSMEPASFSQLLCAVAFAQGPSYEVVISGTSGAADTQAMAAALFRDFLPNKVVLFRSNEDPAALAKIAAYTETQKSVDGKATAYVCRNFACEKPTTDTGAMLAYLKEKPKP